MNELLHPASFEEVVVVGTFRIYADKIEIFAY
jgi:hypothetical protein